MPKFRHLDLFSGIGGFALAASWVWGEQHEIVSFCEIEKFPQKVLKKHWPDVPIHDDIKTMKGDQYGRINLLTGGFPCQPYSVAGKQRGSKDDRALWPEMFRIIKEARPHWIIGENVAGFINMGLDDLLSDLESKGYETTAFIIPACGVDAKHKRDRIFIVAHSKFNGLPTTKKTRSAKKTIPDEQKGQKRSLNTERTSSLSTTLQDVANPNQIRRGRVQQQPGIFQKENKTCAYAPSCFGIPRGEDRIGATWQAEPSVGRVADGISSRVDRIKGLGNAIVPQVVAPIMAAIKQIEETI